MVGIAQPKRRDDGTVDDAVSVSFFHRRVASVKVVGDDLHLHHTHVFPDIAINRRA